MKKISTKDLMNIALDMAGLQEAPPDSVIQVESEDVRRILAGIDMGAAELSIAKQLGYDCVVRHHPQDLCMVTLGKMEAASHIEHMVEYGVSRTIAEKVWAGRETATFQELHAINYGAVAAAARLLGLASFNVHTPADLIVQREVQRRADELVGKNPKTSLQDIIDNLMEIREYASTTQKPGIWVGGPDSTAGKVMVSMAGGCAPTKEEYLACIDAGVNTFICMHMKKEVKEALLEDGRCNVIVAGHYASDSYGFNRILDAWEAEGVEITRIGGIV